LHPYELEVDWMKYEPLEQWEGEGCWILDAGFLHAAFLCQVVGFFIIGLLDYWIIGLLNYYRFQLLVALLSEQWFAGLKDLHDWAAATFCFSGILSESKLILAKCTLPTQK
jgi:hypothetical protein